jgi:ATP-dependent Clp protease ATP-binding subunit ClpX
MLPREMFNALSLHVVGQDHAKKTLSTSMALHLEECVKNLSHSAPRILMIGQTGCGKTYLLKTLKSVDPYINVLFINSTEFTGTAWQGESLSNVWSLLRIHIKNTIDEYAKQYQSGLFNPHENFLGDKLEEIVKFISNRTILVFDEFDKLSFNRVDESAESKKTFQDDLLKAIEDHEIQFDYKEEGKVNKGSCKFNTKDIPIVFLGAFEGFEAIENPEIKRTIGFTKNEQEKTEKRSFKESLVKYGFLRELCGRINTFTRLNKLSIENLVEILDKNILEEYENMFKAYDSKIKFSAKFKQSIAEQAFKAEEGARALKDLVNEQIQEHLFNIENYINKTVTFNDVGITKAKIRINNNNCLKI